MGDLNSSKALKKIFTWSIGVLLILFTAAGAVIWLSEVDVPISYEEPYTISMSDEERYPDEGEDAWDILSFKSSTELEEADFSASEPKDQYHTYVDISDPSESDLSVEVNEPSGWDEEMSFEVLEGFVEPGVEWDERSVVEEGDGSVEYDVEYQVDGVAQFTVVYYLGEEAPDSDGYEVGWEFEEGDVWIGDADHPILYEDDFLIVETKEAEDVDSDSATLWGEVTYLRWYAEEDVDVFFQYRKSDTEEWDETEKESLSDDREFDDEITGLDEETIYEYRAVAEIDDDVYYGSMFNFTTIELTEDNDIYEINDWYELQAMWNDLDGHYELKDDLDEDDEGYDDMVADPEEGWTPIGDQDHPFTGTFDGQGYNISDIEIDRPEENNVGLFGHVGDPEDETVVKNLCIRDADIAGDRGVGTLIGRVTGNDDTGIIRCCARSSTVKGTGAVGGLIGSHNSWRETPGGFDNPILRESFAEVHVSERQDEGSDKFGGLIGCTQKGEIIDSYALGDVEAENAERVGGLAGCAERRGEIHTSYSAAGVIEGSDLVGGLVGNLRTRGVGNDGIVEDSYWDTDASGLDESAGGEGLETGEMQGSEAEENMDDLDFDDIWHYVKEDEDINGIAPDEDGYPILRELDIESQLDSQSIEYNT